MAGAQKKAVPAAASTPETGASTSDEQQPPVQPPVTPEAAAEAAKASQEESEDEGADPGNSDPESWAGEEVTDYDEDIKFMSLRGPDMPDETEWHDDTEGDAA